MRLLLLLAVLFQSASAPAPRLAYVVPTHQAVLYLYEAPPGADLLVTSCEVLASGSWFGTRPDRAVILHKAAADAYAGPVVWRARVPQSGRLYLKASSPQTLEAGRVLVSIDGGATWQTAAGPECRNTLIFPLLKRGAE